MLIALLFLFTQNRIVPYAYMPAYARIYRIEVFFINKKISRPALTQIVIFFYYYSCIHTPIKCIYIFLKKDEIIFRYAFDFALFTWFYRSYGILCEVKRSICFIFFAVFCPQWYCPASDRQVQEWDAPPPGSDSRGFWHRYSHK